MSEGRSGSTLLGDVLSIGNDTFAIYEPFHDFMANATHPRPARLQPPGLSWRGLFECGFADDPPALAAVLWRGQGRNKVADQLDVWDAEKAKDRFRFSRDGVDLAKFGPLVGAACRSARRRLVKVIRLADRLAWEGNTGNRWVPQTSVVHLVRHPDAVARSWDRFTATGRWAGSMEFSARRAKMCDRMARTAVFLAGRVPAKRLITVRYEDLVARPLPTFVRLKARLNETVTRAAVRRRTSPRVQAVSRHADVATN